MTNISNEDILWKAHPTQLLAFQFYFIATAIALLLVGASVYIGTYSAFAGIWYVPLFGLIVVGIAVLIKFLIVRTKEYVLTSQRFVVSEGIFNRNTEEVELYRVRDWSIRKPFWLRIFNCGHVILLSSDASAPELQIAGISSPEKFRESLREQVEAARAKHRVRNVEGLGDGYE
ncbi:MAG: PH domain-containing protein [Myxococcales bacterium]|nr:PH domain-containing protein [Myxococcales bacterium]